MEGMERIKERKKAYKKIGWAQKKKKRNFRSSASERLYRNFFFLHDSGEGVGALVYHSSSLHSLFFFLWIIYNRDTKEQGSSSKTGKPVAYCFIFLKTFLKLNIV